EDNSRVDPEAAAEAREAPTATDGKISRMQAWLPWVILTVFVFIWGVPQFKALVDGIWQFKFPIPGLDKMVVKGPPVVA
ncbi:L-lactate permease, partial [Acinetobacter baumannii]